MDNATAIKPRKLRRRGRTSQVRIYLGKLLRGFVYQSDWKVFPMAALIAALFSMVGRNNFFTSMEGTLTGSFGLACIGIWNGCFNSIQVICRERAIIKREHRSGMHISSYIFAHMLYQGLLCAGQTALTLFVCYKLGMHFPVAGLVTPFFMVDIAVTMFLLTYAADMLSLLISALVHSTTVAMTVMPFLLIFQLVFSGGFFQLPQWTEGLKTAALSNFGLRAICAQTDYNGLPTIAGWRLLEKATGLEVKGEVSPQEIIDAVRKNPTEPVRAFLEKPLAEGLTLKDLLDQTDNAALVSPELREMLDVKIPYEFTVGDVIEAVGRENVETIIKVRAAAAMQNTRYEHERSNVLMCWLFLVFYALLYAFVATVALEFIDKDKR
ncbi:MAG: ABC transporter permease [Clostridia bacterium]|nr:ABC transporter permease [Clostridia bacterium]